MTSDNTDIRQYVKSVDQRVTALEQDHRSEKGISTQVEMNGRRLDNLERSVQEFHDAHPVSTCDSHSQRLTKLEDRVMKVELSQTRTAVIISVVVFLGNILTITAVSIIMSKMLGKI